METVADKLLEIRDKTHGPFPQQAGITQSFKYLMHTTHNWSELNDMQRESLDMIVHKIGRILAGDPNELDHWNDIAGYAKLISKFADEQVEKSTM